MSSFFSTFWIFFFVDFFLTASSTYRNPISISVSQPFVSPPFPKDPFLNNQNGEFEDDYDNEKRDASDLDFFPTPLFNRSRLLNILVVGLLDSQGVQHDLILDTGKYFIIIIVYINIKCSIYFIFLSLFIFSLLF